MSSIVNQHREQLEALGEYVVLANIASGWFAIFENTLTVRRTAAIGTGRPGPNLVVYRTLNETAEPRDHYVVPFDLFQNLLGDETVAESQLKNSRRWNLTLKEGRLRVTHRAGYVDVAPYYRAPLLHESRLLSSTNAARVEPLQLQSTGAIEGIARELYMTARSRSSTLREAAIRASKGVCEACQIDFSELLGGRGTRALQVHHRNQLAHITEEVVTRLEDLAVVCANCHSVIHADRDRPMPVHELRELWSLQRSSTA